MNTRLLGLAAFAVSPLAQAASDEALNTAWLVLASVLVFFMQAGFAMLESGMSRAKNAVNVMMKNHMDGCVGGIVFWLFGFGLMFGSNITGWFVMSHFAPHTGEPWDFTFLLFQMMFAATAATIASGAMAERTCYSAYLVGAVVISGFIYSVFGSWVWSGIYGGQGWLAALVFIDFAGSTVVHSVGAWCALAGILVLVPRLRRFAAANLGGLHVDGEQRLRVRAWVEQGGGLELGGLPLEQLRQLLNLLYIGLCEYLGPVLADQRLSHAVLQVETLHLAYSPRKLL